MENKYLVSFLSVLVYFVVAFIFAQIKKDNSKIDIAWGSGFILVLLSLYAILDFDLPELILLGMVSIWGIRLSIHIYARSKGKPEDYRYQEMRKNWGKLQKFNAFYRVFLLQAILLFVISLPLINYVNSAASKFTHYNIFGLIIFTIGLLFEAIADYQLTKFKKDISNKGKLLTTGLWKISRHPNYFGEAVLWWGFYIYTVDLANWYWTLISPILITFLLVKVSGVPMLEKKYENHPDWNEYKTKTPAFIPFMKGEK